MPAGAQQFAPQRPVFVGPRPRLAAMGHIVAKETGPTRVRWEVAVKDRNFDGFRRVRVAEARPEHFERPRAEGRVSTNVYLRRLPNHALPVEWLRKSVIPRLRCPSALSGARASVFAQASTARRKAG